MTDRNENKPEYKKTKARWIPKGWEVAKLEDICSKPVSGYSLKGDDRPAKQGEHGVLKLSCIQNGRFIPTENKFVKGQGVSKLKTPVRKGPLLICRSNTDELVGAVCFVDSDFPNIFLSDLIWEVTGFKDFDFSVKWFTYLLCSDYYRAQIVARANGTSGSMKKITKSSFLGLNIPVPPVSEQKKIAEILSTWDTAIEQIRKFIEAKKRLLKAFIQQMIIKRWQPSSKNNWKNPRAKEIFEVCSIKKHNNESVLSVTQNEGVVPRFSLDRKIEASEANLHSYKLVEPGDFIISLRSFQGGIEYSKYRGIVSPAYHVIRPKRKIDHSFYGYFFKSQDFISRLAIAVIGIRDGKQINYGDFSFLQLPYPSFKEQETIGKILTTRDCEIQLIEKKLKALEKQKRGLMQKLLTGEIRVK